MISSKKNTISLGLSSVPGLASSPALFKGIGPGGQRRADDSGGNVRRGGFPSGPQTGALCTAHHKLAALHWFRTKYVTSSADEEQVALQLL